MGKKTEWFQSWFDTKYYHLLYDHRNEEEAEFFMKNLISFLHLKKGDKILDLPCGKGRHTIFLNTLGFDVLGADISKNSINFAKEFENENLKFHIHDMRDELSGKYNAIFNLFTSFGYFNDEQTNIKVLKNFKAAIYKNGHIVIDFLNIKKVKEELIPDQSFIKYGIDFHITKTINNGFLIKDIYFKADNMQHHYTEKVQCLSLDKMTKFVQDSNLKVKHLFGNYNLSPFDENRSDRLILILQ
jgi:cyclopropane fatty-acyl-phospholipid synthase-like methyltransferase